MNFLLHRYLAARDLGTAAAGIGAMLPDLWRMADRRVRPALMPIAAEGQTDLAAILAGIRHHLDVDRWFHVADVFVEGERLTQERLRATGLVAPKLGLFAHVIWEMCLDGALLRREGLTPTIHALREGFGAVGGAPAAAASMHHFDRVGRTPVERGAFEAGMRQLFTEIARGPWISGYQSGAGVAQRVDGMRARLGLARFSGTERQHIGSAIDELAAWAHAALAEILGRRSPV